MPRFQFTGSDETAFPSLLTADGTLVCRPGDIVTLDTDPGSPLLVPVAGKADKGDLVAAPAATSEAAPAADPTPPSTEG